MAEPVGIVLERADGWAGTQVKPASAGARFRVDGKKLHLDLKEPRPVLIEGPAGLRVSVLAKPPAGEPPIPVGEGRLIRFAAGQVHEAGSLELKDHDVLWLDAGAWVRGNLIASEATGVVIGGNGILENPLPSAGEPRYRSIILDHCQNATISGIHMMSRHGWMITLGGCDDVRIEGVSQDSDNAGTDGIDIVGSRNVLIRRCFLLNGDDNIAIKAMNLKTQANPCQVSAGAFNGDWTGEVRDVLVEDCAFYNDHGGSAMEIGYETRTERISQIVFRNIDVMAVHSFGSVFGIHTGDRAVIEDITWEDIRVEHHFDMLVDFRILHSRWNRDKERGRVRGITLRNIRVMESEYNEGYTISAIGGWDADHRIEDVTFEDFRINGRHILNGDDLCLHTKQADGIHFR